MASLSTCHLELIVWDCEELEVQGDFNTKVVEADGKLGLGYSSAKGEHEMQ